MSAVLHLFPAPHGVAAPSTGDTRAAHAAVAAAREAGCSLQGQALEVRPALLFWLLLPALLLPVCAGLWLDLGWVTALALAPSGALVWGWHRDVHAMRGLRLKVGVPSPCFAGDTGVVELRLLNPGLRHCPDVAFGWCHRMDDPSGWLDVSPRSCTLGLLPLPTRERGPLWLPPLYVESQSPLSIFRVRARWQPALHLAVCPRPDLSLGDRSSSSTAPTVSRHAQAVARWLSLPDELVADVDLDAEVPARREQALSKLTAQVLRAAGCPEPYGLRLGGLVVPPGRGVVHRQRCLELLAHWRLPQAQA